MMLDIETIGLVADVLQASVVLFLVLRLVGALWGRRRVRDSKLS